MDEKLNETALESELIYDGRVVHLYKEKVRLPDGKVATRDIVRHNGAVAIVPFDAAGNVILVRQYRLAARRSLLEIPAGSLEPGEDPTECAIRELQEEIGYKPGTIEKIGGVFLAPGYSTEFIHLYVARDLAESKLSQDDDEFLELVRVSLEKAVDMVFAGEIADAKSASALLMVQARPR